MKKKKLFTVTVVTTDGRILKIEKATSCTSEIMTQSVIQNLYALYVTTENDTFIFPLNNLIYAKLMKEDAEC